jgi:hypothetical protein
LHSAAAVIREISFATQAIGIIELLDRFVHRPVDFPKIFRIAIVASKWSPTSRNKIVLLW